MRNRRGYVLVATTVFLPALVAFLGLAIDVGYLQWQKIHAQMAADAAAQGAGLQLLDGNGTSSAISEGQYDASLNGFTQGVFNTTVTVNTPPLSGPHAGNSSAAEVIVQRTIPTFFLSVIGQPTATVTSRAVTVLGNNGGAGCVFAMNSSASGAFSVSGNATNYYPCGIEVASSSSTALTLSGNVTLYMKNNASVGVVGNWTISGNSKIINYSTGQSLSPQNISAPADPLSYIQTPSTSGLTVQSMSRVSYTSNASIQPGIYCGGISVSGNANVSLAKGTYYIAGGGFSFSGNSTVSGTGVTFFNTSGANSGVPGCNSSFQPFSISGTTVMNLSAPTSGSLEGILFFQDRKITSSSTSSFSGNSSGSLNGAIYLLHSPLSYSGNSSTGYQILVADKITISGNSSINADYSSLQDGSPIRNAAILEE
jgi:hypothetical protein